MDQHIVNALSTVTAKRIENSQRVPSAVLLPLLKDKTGHHVLFVKRSNTVKHHRGEISFPGGVVESGDTALLDTALRESHEEIGLAPADVTILGQLDDMETASTGYVITPFVGLIAYPYAFRINTDEVETLVIVPLDILMNRLFGGSYTTKNGKQPLPPIFSYNEHLIWGATARILLQLINLIAEPAPPRRMDMMDTNIKKR